MGFKNRLSRGLSKTREKFHERMNIIMERGAQLDDEYWDNLEEALILSDMGPSASIQIVENLRDVTRRKALEDAAAVKDYLIDEIANLFVQPEIDIFEDTPVCVLFVGINGAGKTTTLGKIAKYGVDNGHEVLMGSADTFRAAAIEQLEVWSERAGVEIVERKRGSDPASVCYATLERAEQKGSDLVLIDTAGRLHTSDDLMRELEKVVNVTRKRATIPVKTVLVIDATTGQNGLAQAKVFNDALNLDAVIVTKLDGTAKGGIAVAISHELNLPIVRLGVGEQIEDLRPFDPHDFAEELVG